MVVEEGVAVEVGVAVVEVGGAIMHHVLSPLRMDCRYGSGRIPG
jgi:hypothetical protein